MGNIHIQTIDCLDLPTHYPSHFNWRNSNIISYRSLYNNNQPLCLQNEGTFPISYFLHDDIANYIFGIVTDLQKYIQKNPNNDNKRRIHTDLSQSIHEPWDLFLWIIMDSRRLVPDHEQNKQKHNGHANRRSPGPVNGGWIPTTTEDCRNAVSVGGGGEPPYDQDQNHRRCHHHDWIYLARHLQQTVLFWKQIWHHKDCGHYGYQEKDIGWRRRRSICRRRAGSGHGSEFEPLTSRYYTNRSILPTHS